MPIDPRAAAEAAAAELVRALAGLPAAPTVRVTVAAGGVACLVLVWDARAHPMPTARGEWRRKKSGERAGCRDDILAALRNAGRPLTRPQVVRALRDAGKPHGAGTVAKALAEMTADETLVNPLDRLGYRLPGWPRRNPTPSLFA